ncbi:CCAAT/enhancer-binding protein beta [Thrips palmi]|uniref:CCAAT/enhancer-binding protein beta n=1 Tax=Thrips palmi TaxID=161013 RepID=A0A6P8XWN2_THRPL|nr:CCAAT/enhancer-binding protein beta [Thrips palmi]
MPPGCPITALTLLHSCTLSPSALDAVRRFQPWSSAGGPAPADGDLVDIREHNPVQPIGPPASSSTTYSLCGLGRLEDAFAPLPLSVQLPLPLPAASAPRRPRSEKKPTPEDQKDQRYLERRRRNNRAAKKSRDARRAREDQVALRAALLEHENAVLRAQVMTLREETHSLRQLLLHSHGHGGHGLAKGPPAPLQHRRDAVAATASAEALMRRI